MLHKKLLDVSVLVLRNVSGRPQFVVYPAPPHLSLVTRDVVIFFLAKTSCKKSHPSRLSLSHHSLEISSSLYVMT